MTKAILALPSLFLLLSIGSCTGRPSEKDISKKLLLDYVCNETAKVNGLKILKTEKTESTGQPPIFHFTVQGEVEWPDGCQEFGSTTPPGTREKFERLVTLYKTDEGNWE